MVELWVILMSTPGPFPLKGEMFLTCVAELGGTSGPDLELDNQDPLEALNSWSSNTNKLMDLVMKTTHLINKEEMVHKHLASTATTAE